mgnify:FL=1
MYLHEVRQRIDESYIKVWSEGNYYFYTPSLEKKVLFTAAGFEITEKLKTLFSNVKAVVLNGAISEYDGETWQYETFSWEGRSFTVDKETADWAKKQGFNRDCLDVYAALVKRKLAGERLTKDEEATLNEYYEFMEEFSSYGASVFVVINDKFYLAKHIQN